MKRRAGGWLLVLLLVTLAAGCALAGSEDRAASPEEQAEGAPPFEAPAAQPTAVAPLPPDATTDTGEEVTRMIIYTGELSLVVVDTEAAQAEVVEIAEAADGYVASASSYAVGDGLRRINMTVRVPAEAFNRVMDAYRGLASEVRQDSISSEDVTQEYVDLESRLSALEVKAARLEELMDQAEDTEAVLAVYEELSRTQIQIEETKGRLQYLARRSAMATITVSLTPDEVSRPIEVAGWRPQGTIRRAIETLIEIFQFLIDALIWIVLVVLPVLLFFGLLIYAAVRLLGLIFGWGRKKRRKEQAAAETTPESEARTPEDEEEGEAD